MGQGVGGFTLPQKLPWGPWVPITDIVRHPPRVAAGDARHLVRVPLPLHLAWFPHHPCHFAGGSMTKSHWFFRLYSKAAPLEPFWKGARLN